MSKCTPASSRLEIRMDRRGMLQLYFDGIYVPGVMDIKISSGASRAERSVATVTIIGMALKLGTEPDSDG